MHLNVNAWLSIEGFLFGLVLALLALACGAPEVHLEWLLRPENGFGRLLAHPEVALLHGGLSACILLLMLFNGRGSALLVRLLGWLAVVIGVYAFWWPGAVATVFPLVLGGIKAGLAGRDRPNTSLKSRTPDAAA